MVLVWERENFRWLSVILRSIQIQTVNDLAEVSLVEAHAFFQIHFNSRLALNFQTHYLFTFSRIYENSDGRKKLPYWLHKKGLFYGHSGVCMFKCVCRRTHMPHIIKLCLLNRFKCASVCMCVFMCSMLKTNSFVMQFYSLFLPSSCPSFQFARA